jgi:hypothetical protein
MLLYLYFAVYRGYLKQMRPYAKNLDVIIDRILGGTCTNFSELGCLIASQFSTNILSFSVYFLFYLLAMYR